MSHKQGHKLATEYHFPIRHDWTKEEIASLFQLPLPELIYQAQTAHRLNFDPTQIQVSTLLSIKSGGCPEDCAYCPQSAKHGFAGFQFLVRDQSNLRPLPPGLVSDS